MRALLLVSAVDYLAEFLPPLLMKDLYWTLKANNNFSAVHRSCMRMKSNWINHYRDNSALSTAVSACFCFCLAYYLFF